MADTDLGVSYNEVKEHGQIPSMKLKLLVKGRALKFPKIIVVVKKERQTLPKIIIGGLTIV